MAKVDIPETHYARNGPVSIAYQTMGHGPGDVVFIAPPVSHLEIRWEWPPSVHVFDRLAALGRLLMYDKRGCGLSDRSVETPTVDDDVADVLCIMDAAGVERACVFGVWSGAATALALAARHPDRVERVAAFGGYAHREWETSTVDEMVQAAEDSWGDGSLGLADFAPSRAGDEEFVRWSSRNRRAALSPSGAAEWVRRSRAIDIREELAHVDAPVLVMSRRDSGVVDARYGPDLVERLSDARLVELPGEDYFLAGGDADAVLDEVEEFFTGTRPVHTPTRALATVMFTDIVGSTEQAADMGDTVWRALLARHDDLTRHQVEEHDGRLVKSTGDGALATFDTPATAITAAQSLIADLADTGLDLRVGIHMGEIEITGDDVAGIAVHLASRISALAGPRDIYVSRGTADLMLGSPTEFDDRGTHDLKGIPGQWQILAVFDD